MHSALHDSKQRLTFGARVQASLGPAMGAAHRGLRFLARARIRWALIERHRDVHLEGSLRAGGDLRCDPHLGTVEVAGKAHAVVTDLEDFRQAHDLVAAGIGQQGVSPTHKPVEPSGTFDRVRSRPEQQMISIGKHQLEAERLDVGGFEVLDCTACRDGHERGRFDRAMRSVQPSPPRSRQGTTGQEFKPGRARHSTDGGKAARSTLGRELDDL